MPVRRLSLLLALAWMGYLFYLSHQPVIDLPSLFPYQDKAMHFIAYGVLGVLLLGAMRLSMTGYRRTQALYAAAIASLYGISDEIHQMYVPGRDPDLFDWLADTGGALTATLLLCWLSHAWFKRKGVQPAV